MKIYLDVLVIVNCILELIYLDTLSRVLHQSPRALRLTVGSLIGGASSLLIMAGGNSFTSAMMLTLAKALCVILSLFAVFSFKGFWQKIRGILLYFAVRAAYLGVILVIWQLSDTHLIYMHNYTIYFDISMVKLMIGTAAAYGILTLYELILRRRRYTDTEYRMTISIGSEQLTLPAQPDTGNKLTDPFTSLPVVVLCSDAVYDRYAGGSKEQLLASGFRFIPVQTVTGGSLMPVTSRATVRLSDHKGTRTLRCCLGLAASRDGSSFVIFDPAISE